MVAEESPAACTAGSEPRRLSSEASTLCVVVSLGAEACEGGASTVGVRGSSTGSDAEPELELEWEYDLLIATSSRSEGASVCCCVCSV